jgi:hypothetical protein
MRAFLFDYESAGNIESGMVVVNAEDLVEAQDKFFAWLRTQPLYSHMWNLAVVAKEVKVAA